MRMGTFQKKVRISNPQSAPKFFEEPFWVDTGALYTFIPEQRLYEIGVKPKFTREFLLADGRKETRPVGEAVLKIEGIDEEISCLVVFGPADSLFLLGATALENFGVDADPVNRTLKPIIAIVGGHLTSR